MSRGSGDGFALALWALFALMAVAAFATVTDPTFVRELGEFVVGWFLG